MSISLDSITFPSISGLESDKNNSPPVTGLENIGGNTNSFVIPLAVVIIIVVIIAYYILFSSLGSDVTTSSSNQDSSTIQLFLWGLFILLILLNGMSYIFNLDVIASIKHIFSPVTTVDVQKKKKYFMYQIINILMKMLRQFVLHMMGV